MLYGSIFRAMSCCPHYFKPKWVYLWEEMSTLLGSALCELSAYAGDSFKIPPVAHDPCWAMQRLGLCWLKDRQRTAKHGVVFDDCELSDTESYHIAEAANTLIWWQPVVSMELCWSIQDNLCFCVHLEEITPTRSQTFVGRRWKKSEAFKMVLKKKKWSLTSISPL